MKREITVTAILLGILIVLLGAWQQLFSMAECYYPDSVVGRSDTGLGLTFLDLKEDSFSLSAVRSLYLSEKENDIPQRVDAYYTDARFAERASLDIIYGSYFIDKFEETDHIVIGESLAVELFFTSNAVGSKLFVGGKEYVVCGVYRENDSIVGRISDTSRERVYLPYTHLTDPYQTMANMIFIDPEILPFTAAAESVVQELTGKPIYAERFTSYPDLLAVYTFTQKLFIAVCGWCLAAWMLYYAYKLVVSGIKVRKRETAKFSKYGIIGGVLAVAAILLSIVVSFEPYFPSNFLPAENIFDLSHYITLWTDAVQSLNGSSIFDPWLCFAIRISELLITVNIAAIGSFALIFVKTARIARGIMAQSSNKL